MQINLANPFSSILYLFIQILPLVGFSSPRVKTIVSRSYIEVGHLRFFYQTNNEFFTENFILILREILIIFVSNLFTFLKINCGTFLFAVYHEYVKYDYC